MQLSSCARSILPLAVATLCAIPLGAQGHNHPAAPVPPSAEAQRAFTLIKSLSGAWRGPVVDPTTNLQVNSEVTLRVTSRGHSVVHEIKPPDATDNPMKNDHPVTMMYIDGANLLLTHYCDAGNRPRMTARVSDDGKQIDFDFIDLTGPTTYGHMQHVRFTLLDATHHIEDWTYEMPDGKTYTGHFDLKRAPDVATVSAK